MNRENMASLFSSLN